MSQSRSVVAPTVCTLVSNDVELDLRPTATVITQNKNITDTVRWHGGLKKYTLETSVVSLSSPLCSSVVSV
jgi:hypothetical protein